MDSRIARIRRKLAKVPYAALRSHSFGEEEHGFRLEPPLPDAKVTEFEADHHIELPDPYRSFLTTLGGGGASPFYGLLPLQSCRLFTMDPQGEPGRPRGFAFVGGPSHRGDLFMLAGRDNRDLELISPALRAPVDRILRQHRSYTRRVHAA
ncbi:SMI1/KNR4 family protein [Kitasatospora sp. NPDC086801]|uniref:SMI1/KNR4 family protein n=1 Tax=Kitasatospora sp. NPDC086801 TaxID=3364066 RepID=UPI003800E418